MKKVFFVHLFAGCFFLSFGQYAPYRFAPDMGFRMPLRVFPQLVGYYATPPPYVFDASDVPRFWRYRLDLPDVFESRSYWDSVKPIAYIDLWENGATDGIDTTRRHAGHYSMGFFIFDIQYLGYCESKANMSRILSSCLPPNVGGDVFTAGPFVFMNCNVCVQCGIGGIDHCRPVIKYVFEELKKYGAEIKTLEDIGKYMPITKGGRL